MAQGISYKSMEEQLYSQLQAQGSGLDFPKFENQQHLESRIQERCNKIIDDNASNGNSSPDWMEGYHVELGPGGRVGWYNIEQCNSFVENGFPWQNWVKENLDWILTGILVALGVAIVVASAGWLIPIIKAIGSLMLGSGNLFTVSQALLGGQSAILAAALNTTMLASVTNLVAMIKVNWTGGINSIDEVILFVTNILAAGAMFTTIIIQLAQMYVDNKVSELTGNRRIYYERTGKIPTGEVHHGLPREYESNFNDVGLDIDDYLYDIPKEQHRLISGDGIHTNSNPLGRTWNAEWKAFFGETEVVTQESILNQLSYMENITGIGIYKP